MEELFLFEIFIEAFNVLNTGGYYPKPKDVKVSVNVSKLFEFEIPMTIYKIDVTDKIIKRIVFQCGKSYLFPKTPLMLLGAMIEHKILLKFYAEDVLLGESSWEWNKTFLDLVESTFDTPGFRDPLSVNETFKIFTPSNDTVIGTLEVKFKFCCLGNNVQSNLQILNPENTPEPKTFLLRCQETRTTFQCQVVTGADRGKTDLLPAKPLDGTYIGNYIDSQSKARISASSSAGDCIWNGFSPKRKRKPEKAGDEGEHVNESLTIDVVSVIEHPDDYAFLDLQIISHHGGYVVRLDTYIKEGPTAQKEIFQTNTYDEICGIISAGQNPALRLTSDNINQELLEHVHCPASLKFAELGLGPLAKSKCLGIVTKAVRLPAKYAISNTYGSWDKYGPYGLFGRPKVPKEPFIPMFGFETKLLATYYRATHPKLEKKEENTKYQCRYKPLRLTGGSVSSVLRLKGGGIIDYTNTSSPFYECKEVLNQYDCLLGRYRKSLGPCGKPTCSYAPNISKEVCKFVCAPSTKTSDSFSKCVNVPRKVKPTLPPPVLAPACGNPKCKYITQQLGIACEEDYQEIQYLPKSAGMCGAPMCPEVPLPPIHWDCPDPLPKGQCKNPRCPYLPADLKKLNTLKKNICGNEKCPANPPCKNVQCPARMGGGSDCPPSAGDTCCDNSTCAQKVCCGSLECGQCPFQEEADLQKCQVPDCPFVGNHGLPKNAQQIPTRDTAPMTLSCSNPFCPFQNPATLDIVPFHLRPYLVCSNPCCPFRSTIPIEMCLDQPCPFLKKDEAPPPPPPCPPPQPPCPPPTVQPRAPPPTPATTEKKMPMQVPICTNDASQIENLLDDCLTKVAKDVKASEKQNRVGKKYSKNKKDLYNDIRKKKVKNTSRFIYNIGDKHPGVRIGHVICKGCTPRVPYDQGWLWNLMPRAAKGWKPGVIDKVMAEKIIEYWQAKGIKPKEVRRFMKNKGHAPIEEPEIPDVHPRPTLQIQKREGAYYITLRPLKDPCKVVKNEDPYIDCTPMQFKVIKPKPNMDEGCACDESSSSTSDLDIEFTPPAGLIKPERFQPVVNVIHVESQYNPKDFMSKKELEKLAKEAKNGKGKKK